MQYILTFIFHRLCKTFSCIPLKKHFSLQYVLKLALVSYKNPQQTPKDELKPHKNVLEIVATATVKTRNVYIG